MLDTRYLILDGFDGSFVNLVKLDNLVKWLSSNLDPRLRHSGTSLPGPSGPENVRFSAISSAYWRVALACWPLRAKLTGKYYNIKQVKFQVKS